MADVFADIGKTALLPFQLAGKGLRGIHKGLAPGFHERRQLLEDIKKIQVAGGTATEAGRKMLSEMTGKYSPDMFVSPLEEARTKYWSEGRAGTGPASDLYEELRFWQEQLRGAVDPTNIGGVRTDTTTGKIKGVLDEELYNTAQGNIRRLIKEISNYSQRQVSPRGRGAFDRMGGEATVSPTLSAPPGVGTRGGWTGGFREPNLQGVQLSRGVQDETDVFEEMMQRKRIPSTTTDYEPMSLPQGSLMSKIARMKDNNGVVIGSRRAGDIVRQYPTVSNYLVRMSPAEAEELFGAIEDGMTEEELLQYFD